MSSRKESKVKGNVSALMLSVARNDLACARIVRKEAGLQTSRGLSALMLAAQRGFLDQIAELNTEYTLTDAFGRTALMHAVISGRVECVRALALHESKTKDTQGWTALMYAAASGQEEMVRILMDSEKCMVDNDGWSALLLACQSNHFEVAQLLFSDEHALMNDLGEDVFGLAQALYRKDPALLAKWNSLGKHTPESAPQSAPKPNSAPTPKKVQAAAPTSSDKTDTIMYVYDNLKNSIIKQDENEAGKYLAGVLGDIEGVDDKLKVIQEYKRKVKNLIVTVNQRKKPDQIESAHDRLVQEDQGQRTILMYFAAKGQTFQLGRFKGDLRRKDKFGCTALMYAAMNGHVSIVELLVAEEAGLRDNAGLSACDHARARNQDACVAILEKKSESS